MSEHRPSHFADYIRVYRDGTIESCLTRGRIGGKTGTWKPLKVQKPPSGKYPAVSLKSGGLFKLVKVHLIVAYAWHGEPAPGQLCRHLDDDKLNFHADNLAWGTPKENADDAKRNGVQVGRPSTRKGPEPEPLSEAMIAYRAVRPGRGRRPKSSPQIE